MALPIIENSLYGLIQLETAAWSSPFTWVDRTAELAGGFNYAEGGRVGPPGQSQVDVGTLNATFSNAATIPLVGDLVRLRRYGTTEYAFTGYVRDVSQRIVFDNSVSLNTPITLTTINCADWIGYISQFQGIGVGSLSAGSGLNGYRWYNRIDGLNHIVDNTSSTSIIGTGPFVIGELSAIQDTDFVGSFAEHLDLLSNSTGVLYWATHNLPTNKTTGRTNLVIVKGASGTVKTFTDLTGSAGQLHYTEIDFLNSSNNVSNTIIVNNRVRFVPTDPEVTRIGGYNEENYVVVNNKKQPGVAIDGVQQAKDATSITTYGIRQSEVNANVAMQVAASGSFNLIVNPSVEYSDDGYSGIANSKVRRRQPSQDVNSFAAYDGSWAMRARQSTAAASTRITFSGGEADGIPVEGGTTYYIKGYAARGTVSRTDMIASITIEWFNDDEASISTSTTANTTLTTANTWYLVSGSAAAPATAVRATIRMSFARSGAGNISVGDRLWGDAFMLSKTTDAYFDGDTEWTATNAYVWTGGVGASPSYKLLNVIDDVANRFIAQYSTTSLRATRIRWNAQENLTAVSAITVGQQISLIYDGTTTTYRIVGIDGNVDPERYMIDYYLQKV